MDTCICRRLACLLFTCATLWGQPRLHLKAGGLEGTARLAESSGALKRRGADGRHLLVAFSETPTPALVAGLKSRGMRIVAYVPDSAYLVWAPDAAVFDGLGARWIGRLEREHKISPLVRPGAQPSNTDAAEATYVVEFHSDVEPAVARELAVEHGLALIEHPDLLPGQLLVRGEREHLLRLTAWDEIAYIFPASEDLAEGRSLVGCAGALIAAEVATMQVGQYVAHFGEGWDGPGKNGVDLQYVFQRLTSKLPAVAAAAEIRRAFDEWSRHARIRFTESSDGEGAKTLTILFGARAHGDAYPFDGLGRVLAHTYYPAPPNPEPIAADVHLDDDENWQTAAAVDLFSVALHEVGHALGLAHSDQPGAVMYPYYRRATQLTTEDVGAILEIYAATDGSSPPPPAPPPPAPPPPPPPPPPPLPPPDAPLAVRINAAPRSTTLCTLALSGTTSGGSGGAVVTWTNNRGGSGTGSGAASWSIAGIALATGDNLITVTATDSSGARSSAGVTVNCHAEAIPPVLRLTSPTTGTSYTAMTPALVLGGTASQASGISGVTWQSPEAGFGTAALTSTNWITAAIPLRAGTNSFTLTATAGDNSTASLTLTVTYSPAPESDTTRPSIVIMSPATTNALVSAPLLTVAGTASDNVGVTQVRWSSSTGGAGVCNGTANWTCGDIPLLVGNNSVLIFARDAAGNTGWRSITVTLR